MSNIQPALTCHASHNKINPVFVRLSLKPTLCNNLRFLDYTAISRGRYANIQYTTDPTKLLGFCLSHLFINRHCYSVLSYFHTHMHASTHLYIHTHTIFPLDLLMVQILKAIYCIIKPTKHFMHDMHLIEKTLSKCHTCTSGTHF